MYVVFSGTGTATHLGRSTNDGKSVFGQPASCGGIDTVEYETLTAANGDTLTFVSQNVACSTSPGYYITTGRWVVTGGTGRFRGATGQGDLDCNAHLVPGGAYTFELTGTISAPNTN